jgi:hypothetical protein
MHTYRKTPQGDGRYLYVVGFDACTIQDQWTALRDCKDEAEAAAYVSYLNGGDHPRKQFPRAEP